METMGVIGQQCKVFTDSYNEKQLLNAERHSLERFKKTRTTHKMEKNPGLSRKRKAYFIVSE